MTCWRIAPAEPGAEWRNGVTEMTVASLERELRLGTERVGGELTYERLPRRLRAVGYVRQGFDELGRKVTSPEGQKARVAGCADANDWHLVQAYEDIGWSGDDL